MRIEIKRRVEGTTGSAILAQSFGVFLALFLTVVLLFLTGRSFFDVVAILDSLIVQSFFGEIFNTLNKAIPLIVTGLGISLAFKMKLWNIGGEGQIMIGAMAAGGVAIYFPDLPAVILLPFMAISAFCAGAIWAMFAALPKAFLDVNETILTLMLNYIAIIIVTSLVYGPWKDPNASGFPIAPPLPDGGNIPYLFGVPVQAGIVLAIGLCIVYWFVLSKSKWGYEIRVVGESEASAKYAGISVKKNILLVMLFSGGLAGVAGFCELAGNVHRLDVGISAGYGYTAIIIAWLSKMRPIGIVCMSIFMGALIVGGTNVRTEGLPSSVALMIQGTILLCVLGCDCMTKYSFRLVKHVKG